MQKFLFTGLLVNAVLLLGCATPNTNPNPQDTPTPAASNGQTQLELDANLELDTSNNSSVEADATANTGVAVTESRNLSRAQFLRAMACAEAKSEEGNKVYYSSQITAFSSPATEAQFNQIMQAGGRTQFGVYGAAVKLGCTG